MYLARELNDMIYLLPKLFPNSIGVENRVICLPGIGNTKDFDVLMTNSIPDLGLTSATQCFPLFYYEENNATQKGLFDTDEASGKYIRRDAISDFILERAKQQYGKTVTKEDIFYYVYGFLHSKEYRETFANDLKKMLPRLPLLENVKDFWAFSKAGSQLTELHLNYETVAPAPDVTVSGDDGKTYKVDKMRFPKKDQKDTINYNSKITISNIPAKAYEYVVNGKSAIEWIMERYAVTTHKESGIVNDPNDWAKEVGNLRYILDLLLSIINVSVQTVDIVNSLPKVDFGTEPTESKVLKMYPNREEDEEINIAAEPDFEE
jgi:predicted helicase